MNATKPIDNGDPTKKTLGKLIALNDEELLALVKSSTTVCLDPAFGASMSMADMGHHILAQFIKHEMRPEEACTKGDTSALDAHH